MTLTSAASRTTPSSGSPVKRPSRPRWWAPLLLRLHFYAGVLVGPFILVAAVTGAAYALTPGVEQLVYDRELHVPASASNQPLAEQVQAAQAVVGDDGQLVAVRPAPDPGDTTRVMFTGDGLLESQTRAIFVDPADASIVGDLPVYGTSGSLPLRTWISDFHRTLGLGEVGRVYSELAASWLAVVTLAGAGLWAARWRRARSKRSELLRPARGTRGYRRSLSWHASLGVWVLLGALFLSATGVTWSRWAGQNVTDLRAAMDWGTPSLTTALPTAADAGAAAGAGEHSGHGAAPTGDTDAVDPALFDDVLAVAQGVNVNTGLVEIRPPADAASGWTVTEIQRSFPTEVDSVAISPADLSVVDRVDFAEFGLIAKLARWGIDLHMGVLFGLPNQIALAALALGIAAMVVLGYRMWWQRRPRRSTSGPRVPRPAPSGALTRAPWWGIGLVIATGALIGTFLPLVGLGLIGFVVLDAIVTATRRPATAPEQR